MTRSDLKSTLKTYLVGAEQPLSMNFLLASLMVGLVLGVLAVFVHLSFAAMIFSGPLDHYLQSGIGYLLAGCVVVSLGVALFSTFRGSVALPQDVPAVILALMAAELASQMLVELPETDLFSDANLNFQVSFEGFATVTMAIVLTTILSGLLFTLFGSFKLGSLIRFIPYPVIGGFLAGTGWLVVKGGFGVMSPVPESLEAIQTLFSSQVLWRWLPALVFALVLLLASRLFQHYLVIPTLILAAIVGTFGWFALSGQSLETAQASGMLLGPFPSGGFWQPISPDILNQVHWDKLIDHQPIHMVTLVIISLVALLLNASGIELSAGRDVRLNRELVTAGVTNLFAGLAASPTGYHALSFSVLGIQLKASSRLIGIIVAAVGLAALAWGNTLLGMFPRAVIAGLLMFLGLSLLYEWLYEKWFTLSRTDYLIQLLIVVTIAVYGIEAGIGVGLAAAIVVFVVRYSMNDPILQTLNGSVLQSSVERPEPQQQTLRDKGPQTYIVKLQGFLFFGTANMIYSRLLEHINQQSHALKYLVLDFERVSDMDSSSVLSFAKIAQQASANGFELLMAGLRPKFRQRLGALLDDGAHLRTFATLDDAMRWYEDQSLADAHPLANEFLEVDAALDAMLPEPTLREAFAKVLRKTVIKAGHAVFEKDSPAENIYFVATGQLEVLVTSDYTNPVRLRTIQPGAMFGELAIFLDQPRSATVKATTTSTLYALDKSTLLGLWRTQPDLAEQLNKYLLKTLAKRLDHTSITIQHLMR